MALAQKFRGFITSKAPAAALTGFLTLSSLLPFSNAQAQEPAVKQTPSSTATTISHTPGAPNMAEQYKPTIIRQASDYSETNKAVGIIVSKGKKDEGGLTGQQMASMIEGFFAREGIPAKAFVGSSTEDHTAIGFTIKGILYGPVTLGKAPTMAVGIASQYDDAYGTHLTRKPLTAAAPLNSQQ